MERGPRRGKEWTQGKKVREDDLSDSEPSSEFHQIPDDVRNRLATLGIDADASLKAFLLQIRSGGKGLF